MLTPFNNGNEKYVLIGRLAVKVLTDISFAAVCRYGIFSYFIKAWLGTLLLGQLLGNDIFFLVKDTFV